jgi:hypothetical protein
MSATDQTYTPPFEYAARPTLVAGPTSSYGADDEQVSRVPDSKARQSCLTGQCNGHDALPAGRRFPSQSKKARLEWQRYGSSHPLMWRGTRPSDSTLASKRIRCFHRKMVQVLPAEHRPARGERRELSRGARFGGRPFGARAPISGLLTAVGRFCRDGPRGKRALKHCDSL